MISGIYNLIDGSITQQLRFETIANNMRNNFVQHTLYEVIRARFTLDGMPGKQMSIDADLNAGLIDENEAKERRIIITREAEFRITSYNVCYTKLLRSETFLFLARCTSIKFR